MWLSAATGEGIPRLLDAMEQRLRRKTVRGMIRLQPEQGRQRAALFELGAVEREVPVDDGGWVLELCMRERDFASFIKRENLPADILERDEPPRAATQR